MSEFGSQNEIKDTLNRQKKLLQPGLARKLHKKKHKLALDKKRTYVL